MLSNDNTVLVVLKVNNWLGYKYDKKVSDETTEKNRMEKGAGRFNKKLMPKYSLKPIKHAIQNFKVYFTENTLPYEGLTATRILPTAGLLDFQAEVESAADIIQERVNTFIDNFDKYKSEAEHFLGDAYREEDYPLKEDIPNLYKINIQYIPVPECGSFNAQISNTHVQELNEHLTKVAALSVEELFFRTHTVLHKLNNILDGNTQRIFYSTTTGNIEKTIDQLDKLNYLNVPELVQLRTLLVDNVRNVKAERIKDSKVYKAKLRAKILPILDFIKKHYEFAA